MNAELLKLISHPLVQAKRKGTEFYDLFYCIDCKKVLSLSKADKDYEHTQLWLPLPIDPINPERGVWEWIVWDSVGEANINDGILTIGYVDKYGTCETVTGDPLEVLLKVFLHQQGVEI